jgi:hypothetical protein
MKTLLLAAAVAMLSTAARACTPSAVDFKALAVSPSHLTPEGFKALAPDDQADVCGTRVFIGTFRGTLSAPPSYNSDYLSPTENHDVIIATRAFLKAILSQRNIGSATV